MHRQMQHLQWFQLIRNLTYAKWEEKNEIKNIGENPFFSVNAKP